jgi:hypothetical protein
MWRKLLEFLRIVSKKSLPLDHFVTKWTNEKGEVITVCTYEVIYLVNWHEIELKISGRDALKHNYYIKVILPKFYDYKTWVFFNTKEDVLSEISKKKFYTSKKDDRPLESLKIEELEKLIQDYIKEEKYEKIAEIQAIIDKKIEDEKKEE